MSENKSGFISRLDPNDDAPELTEEWFARGALYIGGNLVRRSRFAEVDGRALGL
jgi:hypothetical protein